MILTLRCELCRLHKKINFSFLKNVLHPCHHLSASEGAPSCIISPSSLVNRLCKPLQSWNTNGFFHNSISPVHPSNVLVLIIYTWLGQSSAGFVKAIFHLVIASKCGSSRSLQEIIPCTSICPCFDDLLRRCRLSTLRGSCRDNEIADTKPFIISGIRDRVEGSASLFPVLADREQAFSLICNVARTPHPSLVTSGGTMNGRGCSRHEWGWEKGIRFLRGRGDIGKKE